MHVSLMVPTRDSFLHDNRLIFVIFDKIGPVQVHWTTCFLKKTENLKKNNKLINQKSEIWSTKPIDKLGKPFYLLL
jgi:hypothetical protein